MIEQAVKEKLHSYTTEQCYLILNEIESNTELGRLWLDKLRRYVSLHGSKIYKKAQLSFPIETKLHLRWITKCLQAGLKKHPNDQALISALLYLSRFASSSQRKEIFTNCIQLERWLLKTKPIQLLKSCEIPLFSNMKIGHLEKISENRIIILSPSPFSLYTLAVYRILRTLNLPVAAIVVRRFTVSRFKDEFSRDGLKFFKKVWRKLILKSNENSDKSEFSLKYVLARLGVDFNDIRKIARNDGVKCIEVNDFKVQNDHVTSLNADIGIFTGGGMVSDNFLKQFRAGLINTHMGSLPQFKGMDVVEAPILEGNFNEITLTSHFMVPALDAGPILQEFKMSSSNYRTLGSLRNELGAVMPFIAVDSCLRYLSGDLKEIEQPLTGRQYYFLHSRLRKILRNILSKRFVKRDTSIPKEVCEAILCDLDA